ncbi:MAG: C45 family peptidase [Endomicrobia bacterium]|nr:C45 family peptidase [Endomicrobiia bacterium]
MNFLKVKGTYYEMGFQQGVFFKQDIKSSFSRLIQSNAIKIIKPKLIPNFLFAKLVKRVVYKKWAKPINLLLPEYSQRIKGISDGAETDISELYVIQSIEIMADDVSYFLAKKYITPLYGCSSICVLQNMLYSPQMVIGKNFDYLSEFKNDHIVRISHPVNGYKSIEITYKQIAGAHDGINEKGLVVLYNYGLSIEKTQTRIPITILVQQLLERCANIDEAITFIKAFRYPNGAIITLADTTNRAVCVELTPEHIGFREPQKGILIATNFYLTEEVKKYDVPYNAVFDSKKAPKEFRNKTVHHSSIQRFNRLVELTKKVIKFTPEVVENMLKDHNDKPTGDDDTICRHGDYLSTQIGMVFIPKTKKIKVYFGPPCKNNVTEFELD